MSTGISAGVDDWLCFTTFYCYDPKKFSLHFFVYFFVTIIIFGEVTSAISNETMTTNIFFAGATPIN